MAKTIVVGLDIRDLKIAKTGAKTYLEEVYKEFQKDHPGFRFHFFDTSIPVYTGRKRFYKIIEQLRFIVWKQIILPIKALIRGCDIVFCTDYFAPWINLNYNTITVFHDAFFWEYPEHYNKYWLLTFKTLGVWAAKNSVCIITPTQYAKQRILNYLPVPDYRIIPVPEAPKTLNHHCETPLRPLALNTPNYLLHVGTFEKRKNLVTLIESFHILRKNGYLDYSLVLAGQISPKSDMDGSKEIFDTIDKYNLQDYVLLPGYVPDTDLSWYYENATLYIFPSLNEGFGLPILEAFQHGLPVLVANNTCLPEVGGDAVLQFDPYDVDDLAAKIKQIIDDPSLRTRLIEKGKARLNHFSWQKTVIQLLDIFKKSI